MIRAHSIPLAGLISVAALVAAGCGASGTGPSGSSSAATTPTTHAAASGKQSPDPPAVHCKNALTRPGSDPSALPGPLLIADKANNRLLEVDQCGHLLWKFPRSGDLASGQTFNVPDDAFFTPNGKQVIATQEDDFAVSLVDMKKHKITYRYGTPGVSGSTANHLYNPDDAIALPGGKIVVADIKNCRVVVLKPPASDIVSQLGTAGNCAHDPPASFGSPNGAFPMRDGGTIVTEINGDWVDVLGPSGKLEHAIHAPGFSYPSDTNEVSPNRFLSADYTTPGAVEEFDVKGHRTWRFAPPGPHGLDHPSLALPLPNGDVLAIDDYNDRVIVIDPKKQKIVWQYGHTNSPGTAPGYLNNPDGADLAPPYSLISNFPKAQAPGG